MTTGGQEIRSLGQKLGASDKIMLKATDYLRSLNRRTNNSIGSVQPFLFPLSHLRKPPNQNSSPFFPSLNPHQSTPKTQNDKQKGDMFKYLACLELAYQTYGKEWDVQKANSLGFKSKMYPQVIKKVGNIIQVR